MRARGGTRRAAVAVAAAVAVCTLAALTSAAAGPGPDHLSPMPFLMNVRYGRSPPHHPPDRPTTRHLEPRADRFFMGSRYGKRSPPTVEGAVEGRTALVCEYTGVMTLYQCYRKHTRQREEKVEEVSAGVGRERERERERDYHTMTSYRQHT